MKFEFRRPRAACLLLAALVALGACDDDATAPDDSRVIQIGGAFSLTGNWSTLGLASKAALEIGVEDVNAYLAGDGPRFRAVVEDTKLDPAMALDRVTALHARGVRVVVGPQSSAEVAAIKSFVDENGVLLVSQSSTAGSLAIAGDNILRLTPADSLEAVAVTALMRRDGIQALVPIWRDDAGNGGLHSATRAAFGARGGTVSSGVSYAATATTFAAQVATLSAQVRAAVAQHGAGRVGVYLAGFDEAAVVLATAAGDATLGSVKWYGSDGVALSGALTANAAAVDFAERVGYPNPLFGLDPAARTRTAPIAQRIRARSGQEPDAFALAVYDAVWIAAQAYLGSDARPDIAALRARFQTAAEGYYGATGWTALNAAGDRANANFDFWSLRRVGGTASWVQTGTFNTVTGTLSP